MIHKFNALIAKFAPLILVLIALLVAAVTFGARDPIPDGVYLICLLLAAAGLLARIDALLERRQ
jgi:hypothetical protein